MRSLTLAIALLAGCYFGSVPYEQTPDECLISMTPLPQCDVDYLWVYTPNYRHYGPYTPGRYVHIRNHPYRGHHRR